MLSYKQMRFLALNVIDFLAKIVIKQVRIKKNYKLLKLNISEIYIHLCNFLIICFYYKIRKKNKYVYIMLCICYLDFVNVPFFYIKIFIIYNKQNIFKMYFIWHLTTPLFSVILRKTYSISCIQMSQLYVHMRLLCL